MVLLALGAPRGYQGRYVRSVAQILNAIGPRSKGVHDGTVWTILARARHHGLVCRELAGRTYFYELTAGGLRRVAWILGQKKAAIKAVGNPKRDKEERE